ncbi:hypothetical protein Tco_0943653 [Tanacetum coccineum]
MSSFEASIPPQEYTSYHVVGMYFAQLFSSSGNHSGGMVHSGSGVAGPLAFWNRLKPRSGRHLGNVSVNVCSGFRYVHRKSNKPTSHLLCVCDLPIQFEDERVGCCLEQNASDSLVCFEILVTHHFRRRLSPELKRQNHDFLSVLTYPAFDNTAARGIIINSSYSSSSPIMLSLVVTF